MVEVNLATPFLDAVVSASEFNDGTLNATVQFSAITKLVFAIIPLGYFIAVLGLIGWRGMSAAKNLRGTMGGGMRSHGACRSAMPAKTKTWTCHYHGMELGTCGTRHTTKESPLTHAKKLTKQFRGFTKVTVRVNR